MALKHRIDFFYSIISPYSYVGFEAITRYSTVWPIELNYKPFSFGAIVKNNPGAPLKNPAKAWYLYHDIPRVAKHWGLEIKMSPGSHEEYIFKMSPNPAMHLLNAFSVSDSKWIIPMTRALYQRLFFNGKSVFEDKDLLEVMKNLKVENPDDMLLFSKTDKVKQILRDNTKEAMNGKAFGAPWFHVHTSDGIQYFFGSDSMALIGDALDLPYKGPIKNSRN